jgi:predicted phage gp36 major capsid-like protein
VAAIIAVADLPTDMQSAPMVDDMVAGANAKASRVAPCLGWDGTVTGEPAPTADMLAEAKLILLGAVKRWVEAGSGAFQQQTAGAFSITTDTRQRAGFNLWPSEITELARLCADSAASRKAYQVDTAPTGSGTGYWSAPDVWVPLP